MYVIVVENLEKLIFLLLFELVFWIIVFSFVIDKVCLSFVIECVSFVVVINLFLFWLKVWKMVSNFLLLYIIVFINFGFINEMNFVNLIILFEFVLVCCSSVFSWCFLGFNFRFCNINLSFSLVMLLFWFLLNCVKIFFSFVNCFL